MTQDKRVYIAYTGGTAGMKKTADGYRPVPGYLGQLLDEMKEFHDPSVPRFDLDEYTPILDSADLAPRNWLIIGEDIKAHYDDYDGFVVVHGTDTMAYTASALS
ncbi:MAG: asparaginase, partial [Acidobacteria bacterium]|nr:asparaginase [Acidobacteriota bacterium]